MPSSHIVKPAADILCDYIDAVKSATDLQEMLTARDQAVLEFRCSYGLSNWEAMLIMTRALTVALLVSVSTIHKEVSGAPAPESATAANFV